MKIDLLVLYEDSGYKRLWPLTAARPTCALRLGARALWERHRDACTPARIVLDPGPGRTSDDARRAVLAGFAEEIDAEVGFEAATPSGPILWWNGSTTPPRMPLEDAPALLEGAAGVRFLGPGRRVIGMLHLPGVETPAELRALLFAESPLPDGWREREVEVSWVRDLWDLVRALPEELALDAAALVAARGAWSPSAGVQVLGGSIAVAASAHVAPGAVLDARAGAIVIDDGALVEPFTYLVGPAYVGRGTQLLGGRIACVTLGPECRVGGEVEVAIFQGYGNKRHQGFLGHAAVGEWTNLGALTTNSDLKNNYGKVRVWVDGGEVDSGEFKVGCFLGDHVKTGIGTLFTTGAVVGTGSVLFAGGRFTPRYLAGWSWWDGQQSQPHRWDKFLATARVAMGRRGRTLTPRYEAALHAAWTRGPKTL
jgi:carbonic anhydrase/acetyltransferase-like protein (isoleucine patch superfamily)